MAIPNPTLLSSSFPTVDAVEEHRNFACPHYDTCLSQCVEARWVNFTCRACELVDVRPEDPALARFLPLALVLLTPEEFAALETRTTRFAGDE